MACVKMHKLDAKNWEYSHLDCAIVEIRPKMVDKDVLQW
jgi:hypothetical protein